MKNIKLINKTIVFSLGMIMLLGLITSAEVFAKERRFPYGCKMVGYQVKYYVLTLDHKAKGEDNSIYFMHNISNHSVKLYQMRTGDEPFIMHSNNTIKPNQWGVYATSEEQVKFMCTKKNKRGEYGEIVDCGKVLDVCEYARVKFGLNNRGNYWVVSSNSVSGARSFVRWHGILLR